MQSIEFKLKECGLMQNQGLKTFYIMSRLKEFISQSETSQQSLLLSGLNEQKYFVNRTIKLLQNQCKGSGEKAWIGVLFVDAMVNYCSLCIVKRDFVEFLEQACVDINEKLRLNDMRKIKSRSFMEKVSSGLSKISSMMNIEYYEQKNNRLQKDNPEVSHFMDQNSSDISSRIVQQYLLYVRKKLQHYILCRQARERDEKKKIIIIQNDSQLVQLRENVWKIINLINHHINIVKQCRKIDFMENNIKPFIVSTFVMLCQDCLLLYPYIVKLVNVDSDIIKRKYQKVNALRQPKEIKQKKLEKLSQEVAFTSVDNLLRQLTQINETILYLFCGKLHQKYVHFKVPSNYFLNTAHPRLDQIYAILKQVKQAVEKRQKSKLYMTLMTERLDYSVSRVVDRSLASSREIKCIERKETQDSNEDCEDDKDYQGWKKKSVSFFIQKTQEI